MLPYQQRAALVALLLGEVQALLPVRVAWGRSELKIIQELSANWKGLLSWIISSLLMTIPWAKQSRDAVIRPWGTYRLDDLGDLPKGEPTSSQFKASAFSPALNWPPQPHICPWAQKRGPQDNPDHATLFWNSRTWETSPKWYFPRAVQKDISWNLGRGLI